MSAEQPTDARLTRVIRAARSDADELPPLAVNRSAPRAVVCLCSSGCNRCEPDEAQPAVEEGSES